MGRSRAEHDPATSPARFLRRTRTKTPDPIPGFPSPFGPPANPQPPVAPESATAAATSATDALWDWTPTSVEANPVVGASGYGGAVESAQPRAAANQTSKNSAVRTPQAARPPAAAAPGPAANQTFDATGHFPPPPTASSEKSGRRKRGKRERATEAVREVLAPTGFEPEELAQRLPDTLRGVGEQALVAVRKWADPRERELRKRRRARRRSFRLGTASGLTTAGTVGLMLISAPAWAVVIVGGGAVALVTGTAVTAKRYLEMRREPLPQAAFVARKLPPIRSAARASIARLVKAERALHGLHLQIARSGRLPEDDLEDTVETAASGAAALHALAQDVVAMERASGALGVNSPLGEHVRAVSIRLDGGVVEYEGMVAAAARVLAVPDSAAVADQLGWAMVNLRDAADRLDGWAQALTDLADQRYRANP
ncbi:hypothetical protein ACFXHA_12185 [Nocardia sp. NPDC059240]|uniref:phage shock envelope stress response protein PspM n=1 Tax=Nocardia sp. NPDC059240 TaxID=3346786 RepID=UPI0036B9E650